MSNPETFPGGTSTNSHSQSSPTSDADGLSGLRREVVGNAKEKATDALQSGVAEVKTQVADAKYRATLAAERKVGEVTGRARSATEEIVHQKKSQISGQLGLVTDALNRTSQKLHADNHSAIAQYTDAAVEKVESIRQQIESRDVNDLLDDVQSFTRRQPALVFGGLFVAGLAAMRFMKASSQQRTEREISRNRSGHESNELTSGVTLTPQQAAVAVSHEEVKLS